MPEPAPRGRNPFDNDGVERGADGIARYTGPPGLARRTCCARASSATPTRRRGRRGRRRAAQLRRAVGRARRASPAACARAGVERGDRVAIRLPNGVDWVLAFCGAQLAGAVVVPVNTRFTEHEVAYVVEDSGAAFTFVPGAALPDGEPVAVEDLEPDDLAAIFYTSGTTGFPKGAMTSHANFLANSENAIRCIGVDRAEGTEHRDARQRAAVPRHRLQQPADPAARARRRASYDPRPTRSTSRASCATVGEQRRRPARLGAGDLPRADAPPELRRARRQPRALGLLRRRADRRRALVHAIKEAFPNARVGNGFGLTETSSLTRFLPARGGGRARRLGRLRDAGRRPRDRRARPRDGRRRAARARAERRAGLLEQARGDARRRSSTAGCTPATSRASTTTGCSTSSIARRT